MKKKTKEQKDAMAKAALRRRVVDITAGAIGGVPDGDYFANAENLSKIIPAIRDTFDPEKKNPFMWKPHCIHHFDNVDTTTDFLFEYGYL